MARTGSSGGRKPAKSRNTARSGNEAVLRGDGGETHQIAGGDVPILTTQQGVPVADDQNSLKVGPRGPTALEDFHFREKIFHFDGILSPTNTGLVPPLIDDHLSSRRPLACTERGG